MLPFVLLPSVYVNYVFVSSSLSNKNVSKLWILIADLSRNTSTSQTDDNTEYITDVSATTTTTTTTTTTSTPSAIVTTTLQQHITLWVKNHPRSLLWWITQILTDFFLYAASVYVDRLLLCSKSETQNLEQKINEILSLICCSKCEEALHCNSAATCQAYTLLINFTGRLLTIWELWPFDACTVTKWKNLLAAIVAFFFTYTLTIARYRALVALQVCLLAAVHPVNMSGWSAWNGCGQIAYKLQLNITMTEIVHTSAEPTAICCCSCWREFAMVVSSLHDDYCL